MAQTLHGLNLYPDGGLRLREVLAAQFDLKVENVIAGSGSEGIMSSIIRAFLCDEDEVLTTEAAFIGFQVLARSRGVKYRTVPYRDWHYDLPALAAQINEHTKIIYLANPNNPTGTIFTRQQFDDFYRHVPERVLIILDEAYFEYAQDNPRYPDSMHYRYDNVITLRTFSKVYGLAGARIGYGFAHEELIRNLLKVKLPFEPSTPAQAAGIAALADKEFLHRSLELNARGLRYLSDGFRDMGLPLAPSEANFMMTRHGRRAGSHEQYSKNCCRKGWWCVRSRRSACRTACGFPPEQTKTTVFASKHSGGVMQALEHPTQVEKDFLPLNGTDHVEFYVGNARQAAYYYRAAFGFRLAAYRGPETGTRESASYVLVQNKIRLVLHHAALARAPRRGSRALAWRRRPRRSSLGGRRRIGVARDHAAAAPAASANPRRCATTMARRASRPSPPTATPSTLSSNAAITTALSCRASCRGSRRHASRGPSGCSTSTTWWAMSVGAR